MPGRRGRPYRYVYCLAAARPTNFGNALAKHDTHTGEARLWYEQGGTTGDCLEMTVIWNNALAKHASTHSP